MYIRRGGRAVGLPHLTRGRDRDRDRGQRGRATAHRERTVLPVSIISRCRLSLSYLSLSRPARAPPVSPAGLASLGLAYKFRATPTPALSGLSIARENPTKPSYQHSIILSLDRTDKGET